MKRFFAVCLALMVFCSAIFIPSMASAEAKYAPGTYSAQTSGSMGIVKVTAGFNEKSIVSVHVDLPQSFDQEIGTILEEQIMSAQSNEIEGVSSNTLISTAVKLAVRSCMDQAIRATGVSVPSTPMPKPTFLPVQSTADVVLEIPQEYSIDGETSYALSSQEYTDLLESVGSKINSELAIACRAKSFPHFESITANDDYTVFTVCVDDIDTRTTDEEASLRLMADYAKQYALYCQKDPPEIRVNYVNKMGDLLGTRTVSAFTGASVIAATVKRLTPIPTPKPTMIPIPTLVSTPAQIPAGASYVLNTNTKKFHYPSCASVSQIKDKNRYDYFGTREDVIAMGYSPCGNCHP